MSKVPRYEPEGVEIEQWQKSEILDRRTRSLKEWPWFKVVPYRTC